MNERNGQDVPHHPHTLHPPHAHQRWYPRLLRLLDEQLSLAGRLEALATRQRECVAGGDLPEVLDILAQREPIVSELTRTAEEVEPFVRDARSPASELDATQRHEVQERLTGIEERLEAVNRHDALDERTLTAMKDALAAEIAGLRLSRAAVGAYADSSGMIDDPSDVGGSRLQDRLA